MKNTQKIVVLTAVAASFILANRVLAEDQLLSPSAKGHQQKIVSGTNNDPDLAHGLVLAPKAQAQRYTIVVGNSKNDPDLVHQYASASGTPKQRDQQPVQYEVAPTK